MILQDMGSILRSWDCISFHHCRSNYLAPSLQGHFLVFYSLHSVLVVI